jgi:uncharacterized damage-inducible protein DinB
LKKPDPKAGLQMTLKTQFTRMADYNQWMNTRVYDAASRLEPAELHADKGAFFGSVFGTLNHILVADTIWMNRFARHPRGFRSLSAMDSLPTPQGLSKPLYADFEQLRVARRAMDAMIIGFCTEALDEDYDHNLSYTNLAGQAFNDAFDSLVQHFFNHQTHHRGQVTTLLSQAGIDVGATDLVAMLRERQSA